jgi:hypothetical protein
MAPITLNNLSSTRLLNGDREISICEVLSTLNYGNSSLFWQLNSTWGLCKQHTNMYWIWDTALVSDLAMCLFNGPNVFQSVKHKGYYAKDDTTFESRCNTEDLRILLGTLAKYSQTFAGGTFMFPHSYLVAGLIRFICYLRERMKDNIIQDQDDTSGVHRFIKESPEFWKTIYRTFAYYQAG